MRKLFTWLWLGLAVAGHVGLLVGWRWQTGLVPYFFDATVLSGGRGLDFYSIYQAGYNARHGVDIYENDPARGAPVVVPYFTPYRYLPVVAYTVGLGLSWFKPLTAYKLWVVLVELTLLGCVGLTVAREKDGLRRAVLASMWLCFSPFYLELFMGQFSLVQAALIFGLLLVTARGWPPGKLGARLLDGLWITSLLWKINTFVFGPLWVRARRWSGLLWAAGLGLLVTVPYFIIFPAHTFDFLRNNFGQTVAAHELGNLGLRQLVYEGLAVLGVPAAGQQVAQWLVVGAVLLTALLVTFPPRWLWPRLTRPESLRWWLTGAAEVEFVLRPALLSLWLAVYFLISPQIWEHHYVMLLPALVLALSEAWPRPRAALIVFGLWLCLALPTPFGFTGLQAQIAANHDLRSFLIEPVWRPLLQHASKAVPAVLFFVYLACTSWSRGEKNAATQA